VLLVGGDATRAPGLAAADRVAAAMGARLLGETFPARIERGAGRPALDRLAYLPAAARHQLGAARHLVLAGARSPAAFFGHPGQDGDLVPPGCTVHRLAGRRGARPRWPSSPSWWPPARPRAPWHRAGRTCRRAG
jgi:acetolactate synthase-1/2/3 large subunit